ncbi:MAG: type III-B CRISPR module RAMP protein Cmr1 [Candidatus Hadarchaeales archaeon]
MEKLKLAEVELETLTPSLLGGYDTGSYSYVLGKDFHETPRPPEIKGCLRWWLRALLAGALWEAGKSEGEIKKEVNERVGRIFGTTFPPEKSTVSQISLHVEGFQFVSPRPVRSRSRGVIPRLRLLVQGYKREEKERENWRLSCFPEGLRFKLSFHLQPKSNLGEEEKEIAMWSIALYLIFGGIGAITRRGFGALRLTKEPTFFKEILVNYLHYDKITSELVRSTVGKALESAHKLLGTSPREREETPPFPVPPFPVLVRSDNVFKTEVREVIAEDSIDLLVKLGCCTLKEKWKRQREEKGYPYDTWILGLPRKGKIKDLDTGYLVQKQQEEREGHERRASAICLKPLAKAKNEKKWKILVYGFLSRDWPEKRIKHYSAEPIKEGNKIVGWKPLSPQLVKTTCEDAFKNAWEKILNLLAQK